MSRRPAALTIGILATALVLGAPAAAANAVDPGEGAVIYNDDLTPIGAELSYGGVPQYEFTTATTDDDYWGLDAQGEPAHDSGGVDIVAGIPLGFTVQLGGVAYDGVVVNSNGGVCLTSSTDSTASVTSHDFQCWFYSIPPAHIVSDDTYLAGSSMAIFQLGVDHLLDDDFPVDTDSDGTDDACEYGSFFVESQNACTSVFWGTTTYEGRPAFAATWYFAPDYEEPGDTDVAQILLVDDGAGDLSVVVNVDRFFNHGYDLSYWQLDPAFAACALAYDDGNGDTSTYIGLGGAFRSANGATGVIDLFGPECAGGLDPTSAASLVDGASDALNEHSLNSTQPGRYVFYVRDGGLTVTAAAPVEPAAPTLPATGVDTAGAGLAALALLALGAAAVAARRRAAA